MECSMYMKHKTVSKAIWNDSKNVKQGKVITKYGKVGRKYACKLTLLTK